MASSWTCYICQKAAESPDSLAIQEASGESEILVDSDFRIFLRCPECGEVFHASCAEYELELHITKELKGTFCNRMYVEIETENGGNLSLMVEPEILEKLQQDKQYLSSFTQAIMGQDEETTLSSLAAGTASDKSKGNKLHWDGKEAELMVSLRIEKDIKFQMGKTHKALWEEISQEMEKKGYTVTGPQCSNKWKSLKRDYRNAVDHNSKSGNGKQKKCKFYEDLNMLYGNKPSTKPICTIDTSSTTEEEGEIPVASCSSHHDDNPQRVPPNTPASDSDTSETGNREPELPKLSGKRKKNFTVKSAKKRRSSIQEMIDWMEGYKQTQQEMQEKQLEFQKKQESERLSRMDRFLDILQGQNSE